MNEDAAASGKGTVHAFQAETSRVLDIVIHSLYSHREIFLRELLSNAADALDKLRFAAITDPGATAGDAALEIRILPDAKARTLTIEDTGIGMSKDDLVRNLGTIAHSGTRRFLESLKETGGPRPELIGQFGVGFYSAFIVADRVVVRSKAAGSPEAWRWASDGREGFTVEEGEADSPRGTSITLHLKEDAREFLEESVLRSLVRRYSDYLAFPVRLLVDPKKEEGFETVNRASALWRRPKKDITPALASEFYRHLTHEAEDPLESIPVHVEGSLEFHALLFIPRRAASDPFLIESRHGVRLHVKRVFIMDDCESLLPPWLRFVKGIVDSDDLPLNVSRELLQEDRVVRQIRTALVGRILSALEKMAADRPDDYKTFLGAFGAVLKEGFHFEPDRAEALAELLRFPSSKEEWTGLSGYVERMGKDQDAIYYALGPSLEVVAHSPHTEASRKAGIEVLYFTDPIDEWVVSALGSYRDRKLVSTMNADLGTADGAPDAEDSVRSLVEFARSVLKDRVADVRASKRLVDSPACLVLEEGGLHPHVERLLRARHADLPGKKRVLEINPAHPAVQGLCARLARDSKDSELREWVEVLHDQALLAEGSPIEDPHLLARRMAQLLTKAAQGGAAG